MVSQRRPAPVCSAIANGGSPQQCKRKEPQGQVGAVDGPASFLNHKRPRACATSILWLVRALLSNAMSIACVTSGRLPGLCFTTETTTVIM